MISKSIRSLCIGITLWMGAVAASASSPESATLAPIDDANFVVVPESERELIDLFAHAYRTRDLELYQTLFVNEEEHGVPFTFVLVGATEDGTTEWGYHEEMRVHRRMFAPQTLPPAEALRPELWVTSIALELVPQRDFEERYDLYRSDANLEGLDRKRWRATDAEYSTRLSVTTRGAGVLRVVGTANFVVVEDLTKAHGEEDKFLIYRWVDEGRSHNARQRAAR